MLDKTITKMIDEAVKEIIYPTSLQYVPLWAKWEIIRELISNAEDTKAGYKTYLSGNDFIIEDYGEGLCIKHLLFGVSEKSNSEEAIGQFGEGLKLSLLVMTRMGYSCDIYSGNLHLWNDSSFIAEVEVLKVSYQETQEYFKGTKIVLHDWGTDTFEDRFIFNNQDSENLVVSTENGQILDNQKLFVKGVYVNELPDYKFGYNVYSIDMNRDRSAVSEYQVHKAVGKIWSQVDDPDGWEIYFNSVKSGSNEKYIEIREWDFMDGVMDAIQEGFYRVFGKNAILSTSESMTREAKHKGAGKAVESSMFGYYMVSILQTFVKTDKQWVEEKSNGKDNVIPVSRLNETQKAILKTLKKIAKLVKFEGQVLVAEFEDDANGKYDKRHNIIKISVSRLDDGLIESKSTMIHELAHWKYGTEDTTDAHVMACTMIGAMLSKI